MSCSPFRVEAGPLEAELAKLYGRLAAIDLAIENLERYAKLTAQSPDLCAFGGVVQLETREAY